jgi:hypothetical protein
LDEIIDAYDMEYLGTDPICDASKIRKEAYDKKMKAI